MCDPKGMQSLHIEEQVTKHSGYRTTYFISFKQNSQTKTIGFKIQKYM